jgi:hypothetical protein
MNINDWLKLGFDLGFCSQIVCSTHDGAPTTSEEYEHFEINGEFPCLAVVRIYDNIRHEEKN